MKRSVLTSYFLVCGLAATGQTIDWAVGFNKWYCQPDGIRWLLAHYQPIYQFQPRERVASIGAGQAIREIVFSLMADSLSFYIQDINPYWLEPDKLTLAVQTIYQQAGHHACTSTFTAVRGKAKESRLPRLFFDKILIENSLHEFEYPTEMLQSIRENLKPDGRLFIWELIAKKPHRKHPDCHKPIFTDETLIQLLTANGFTLVSKIAVDPPKGQDFVYQFRLAADFLKSAIEN